MTKLSVNLNKVATLRNTRTIGIPSPARAARIALEAGAEGITLHPRPDERHIRPGDMYEIAALLQDFPDAEFNIEGNPFHGLLEYVRELRPEQCTLVPDAPDAFTSNQGWNMKGQMQELLPVIAQLREWGTRVSLFMDPDPDQMAMVAEAGADRIELYTEPYAAAFAESDARRDEEVARFAAAAESALEKGLGVNAGHDLNLENLGFFLENVPGVAEVSIGHALIADALEYGLADTVRRYRDVIAAVGEVSEG